VTTEQVEHAYRESRGWPAGFSLLLHQGSPSIKSAREVLFEYFAGELFDRLDARTRSLLLRTAPLPQFTAAMAVALGEEPEAAAVLERLQQGAHFLLCRPGSEAVYEFHPLYREYLLTRARRDLPADLLAALRDRGGDLLTQAGEVEQAAELFRESGNEDALSRLVLAHGAQLAREGRYEVLKGWLAGLPEQRIQDTPWLLYWRGIARLYSDRAAAARMSWASIGVGSASSRPISWTGSSSARWIGGSRSSSNCVGGTPITPRRKSRSSC
jgi:LuxR family maltose regulon positive regulatory protein